MSAGQPRGPDPAGIGDGDGDLDVQVDLARVRALTERRTAQVAGRTITPAGGLGARWSRRQGIAALILTPIAFALYAWLAAFPTGWDWFGVLALLAVGTSVIYASYLPASGRPALRVPTGPPCGSLAVLFPVLAVMSMGSGTPGGAGVAVFFVLLGVVHRMVSSVTCAVR